MARNRGVAAGVIILAAFLVGAACPPGGRDTAPPEEKTPSPAGILDVQPWDEKLPPTYRYVIAPEPDGPEGWGTIPPIRLAPGESQELVFEQARVWMLIPDDSLEVFGSDVAASVHRGFMAVLITSGSVVLRLPVDYAGGERTFHYSVLADRHGTWSYVHGNNPPPRMIIGG